MNSQNKNPDPDADKISFTEAEIRFIKKLDEKRVKTEDRFPLVTALLATFGFVSLLYGFEKLIDQNDFLTRNPLLLLVIGLTTLGITGKIYKKLN